MKRTPAILLTLVGLAFVAAGVFLAGNGETEDRSLALGAIAFFGACALIGAANLLPKQRLSADPEGAFNIYSDAGQSLALILGSGGMAVGCLIFAPAARSDGDWFVAIVGWFGAAFFGLGVPIGIWRLLRPTQLIRLDTEGVTTFGPNGWSVKWRDVRDISRFEIRGQRFLGLNTDESALPTMLGRLSDALNLPRFALSVTGSNVRFEDLETQVRALWAAARGTR